MRKFLGNALRAVIAVGILYYLFRYKIDVRGLWDTVRQTQWGWVLVAVALFGVTFWCGVCRWHLLLQTQAIFVPLRRVAAIGFVGQFFNAFLIGGTGGDVVRAYYATRQTTTDQTEAVTSVVVDRMIGTIGLFVLVLAMMAAQAGTLRTQPALRWPAAMLLLMIGSAALALALSLWRGLGRKLPWIGRLRQKLPAYDKLVRALRSYHSYLGHRGVLLRSFGLSVSVHVSNFIGAIFLGWAVGIDTVSWEKYFLLVPMINSIASLPITVSGFGVREELYRRMFGAFGVAGEQAVALSLLSYGVQLVWSLAGGLVYMFWKHEPHLARHARKELVD